MIIGTNIDQRSGENGENFIYTEVGESFAKSYRTKYIECSAKTKVKRIKNTRKFEWNNFHNFI